MTEDLKRLFRQKEITFSFWEKYDENHTVVRFATSWATTGKDIRQLGELLIK